MVCLEKQWLYKQAQTILKNWHNQINVNNLLPKTMLVSRGAIAATPVLGEWGEGRCRQCCGSGTACELGCACP